jgi:hypothetical protein
MCLVRHFYHGESRWSPATWVRHCGAMWIYLLRVCVVGEWISASSILIGTADGAFNVMLNSLAISFLLDLDVLLGDFSYNLPHQFRLGIASHDFKPRIWASCIDSMMKHRNVSQTLLKWASNIPLAAGFIVVCVSGWKMQVRVIARMRISYML